MRDRYNFKGLEASATWDPGSIAAGAMEATDVTVSGASLGDYALASLSIDVADLILTANVTAANTVTAVLSNNTSVIVNPASCTLYVKVIPRGV